MNNFRLIKIGTTQAQRKLFFNLRRQQTRLEANGFSPEPMLLARHLGVKEHTVAEMEHRLSVPELSVYAPLYEVDKPTTLLDRVAAKHATPEREVTEHEYRIWQISPQLGVDNGKASNSTYQRRWRMQCRHCGAVRTVERAERTELGYRRFRCQGCGREFNERIRTLFNRLQYPSDGICLVVLWRFRHKLSLRNLAEMFLERDFVFTHETVRQWETTFAPLLTDRLRKHRYGQGSRRWHVDETLITVNGKWLYSYRALDHEGNLLDVRVSETRDLPAARAFFRSVRLLTKRSPLRISSYRHGSHPDAIWLGFRPAVIHYTKPYANNLLEQDHRQVKQRTRPMQRFRSLASAERTCQAHNEV